MFEPEVSVIIPSYNLGAYLGEAVRSVQDQTYTNIEIIVVDDGSTEIKTIEVYEELYKEGVKIIRKENEGLAATRNRGISEARGELISCLDADDRLHKDFVTALVNEFSKDVDKKLGFVTSWVKVFGEREEVWKTSDYDPVELAFNNPIHVASLFRKECWSQVGGYNTDLKGYQDWNFWLKIADSGYQWSCVQRPLFFYRVRENSMVTRSDKLRPDLQRQIRELNHSFYCKNLVGLLEKYDHDLDHIRSLYDQTKKDTSRIIADLSEQNKIMSEQLSSLRFILRKYPFGALKSLGETAIRIKDKFKSMDG